MNARIIKETRSLLPVFAVMLLGAVTPPLIWRPETAYSVGVTVFVACSAILGASCLGNEFQWRTLGLLLSQPVPRRRIWLEKMLVLGCGVAIGFVVFLACVHVPDSSNDNAFRWILALIPLVALCSAPFLALAVRNTVGAAVLTVFLPVGCLGLLAALEQGLVHFFPWAGDLIDDSLKRHPLAYPATGAIIYCLTLGWLGYRKFMGQQVVDSQAQDINLPVRMEAALAKPLRRLVPGYTGPWASLFRKELQLQRASFIIAGLMVALAPLQLLSWKLFNSQIAVTTLAMNLVICVFVIPLVATGMSVAEERNLGVAAWQFMQPVSARKQWIAKILVVLFICVTLGVLLPVAGIVVGKGLFHFQGFNFDAVLSGGSAAETLVNIALPVLFYLLLLSLGIFASSISRTTLQAIIYSIGLIALCLSTTALIVHVSERLAIVNYHDWFHLSRQVTQEQVNQMNKFNDQMDLKSRVFHFYIDSVGWLLLVLSLGAVQWLTYANFRKGEQASHRGRIAVSAFLIIIIGGFVIALTTTSWTIAYMLARLSVNKPF